jgi:transcriptional regulator with XRE-family HTH domain/tetratricopeptide (TPR) repeat protein
MRKQNEHPLRLERLRRGWTQQQLADYAGVALNTIARAEQGKPLRVDVCRLLCDCLGKEKPEDLGLRCYGLPDEPTRATPLVVQPVPSSHNGHEPAQHEDIITRVEIVRAESSFVDEEERHVIASPNYDTLEIALMKMIVTWQQHLVYPLQMNVRATIKEYDHMHEPMMNTETKLSRRQALQAIVKLPIQVYGLTALGFRGTILPPAEELLPLYAAGLAALRPLSRENDLTFVEHVLADYLPTLETLAQQSSRHQQTAAHLAAQGYIMRTLVADGQGKLDVMESYSKAARYYGQLAQDPNLEASALARLAVRYGYVGRDVQSLQAYQEAAALPGFAHVSPLLQGRIYAGLAGKHASFHHEQEALAFLGRAKDVFPDNPEEDPSFHFALSNRDTLVLWEGWVYRHLGYHPQAWSAFTKMGQLNPMPDLLDRNRAEFINDSAGVAFLQGDLATGFTYLQVAEDLAWTIQHEQRYTEVLETYRLMKSLYPHEQATKEMREIINSRQG